MIPSVNPRTGQRRDGVHASTVEQAREAIDAADMCFRMDSLSSSRERLRVLQAVQLALESERAAIVEAAAWESGLGIQRLESELDRTVNQLEMFADVLRNEQSRSETSTAPSPRGDGTLTTITSIRIPLGPVAVWAASNFPLAFGIPGGDTASAIAAGCPVLVKAHPSQPVTSRLVADSIASIFDAAGIPDGVLSVLFGDSAAEVVIEDPRVKAGAFTGSLSGGMALAHRALQRSSPMPFFAEMGGVNPVVILPAADAARADEIAEGFVVSLTQGSGQFCTKPGLLVVPKGSRIPHMVSEILPVDEMPALNGRIASAYRERVATLLGTSVEQAEQPGAWMRPSLMSLSVDSLAEQNWVFEECFGPFAVVADYQGLDDLRFLFGMLPGALVTSVFFESEDSDVLESILGDVSKMSGRIACNAWPTGVAVTPAMHHGGPFPASTDSRFTSVGIRARDRFERPVALQDAPQDILDRVLVS